MSTSLRIVVADDDDDYRFLFEQSLLETGILATLTFTTNGIETIAILNTMSVLPDMIFLDINMPKMDGLTALQHIRANEVFSQVPIIIFSCTEDPDKVQDAYEKGATMYVRKPTNFLDYVCLLRRLLDSEKKGAETSAS